MAAKPSSKAKSPGRKSAAAPKTPPKSHASSKKRRGKAAGAAHLRQTAIRNIAGRKQAEDAIRQSEQRFQEVAQAAEEWIWEVDAQGLYTYSSHAVEHILGYTPEEIVGRKHFYDFFPSDDREAVKRAAFEVFGRKEVFRGFPNRAVHKNGRTVWLLTTGTPILDAGGNLLGYHGADMDVTERRATEEAIRQSERQMALVLDNTGEIIAYHNTSHCIQWANKAYVKTTALSLEELTGRKCYEAWGLDRLCNNCPVTKAMQTGEPCEAELTPQNQEHWPSDQGSWLSRAAPVRDSTGAIVGAIEIAYDITDRKQAEELVKAYQQRLRSLGAKLAVAEEQERRRIAAGLHDNVVQALALAKIKLEGLAARKPAAQISQAILEIRGLVDQSVHDARSLLFDLSPVALYELGFEPAVESLLERIQATHGLATSFRADDLPKPMTNDVRVVLFRGFREVLQNVVRHAQARGVGVSVGRDGETVLVEVQDDGVGFDAEKALSIRDAARGFGLFDVRERLDYLGGSLTIQSEPGKGTTAILRAPLMQEKACLGGMSHGDSSASG